MDASNVTPLFAKDKAIEWVKQNPNLVSYIAAGVVFVFAAILMLTPRKEKKSEPVSTKRVVRIIEKQPIVIREKGKAKKMSRRDPNDDTASDIDKKKAAKEAAKKEAEEKEAAAKKEAEEKAKAAKKD